MKTPGIYLIRNHVTRTLYVGHSADTGQRIRQHRHRLRHGTHANPHLQNAWNKYGPAAFTFRHIATVVTLADRCAAEVEIITRFRNKDRLVYNVGDGGEGQTQTPESRQKISDAQRGRPKAAHVVEITRSRYLGKKLSAGHAANIRAALQKHWATHTRGPMPEETRRKISKAKMGTPSHPWSEESRRKLSASQKGHPVSDTARRNMRAARLRVVASGIRVSKEKTFTFDGKTLCINDWAKLTGIERRTLGYRLGRGGWSVERALATPVDTAKGPR